VENYLDIIPEELLNRVVLYVPVDAGPYQEKWLRNFHKVKRVVAYTQFGKKILVDANPKIKNNIQVIPHGVDEETFFPEDTQMLREKFFSSIGKNDFVVLNVNRNQPRKRIDIAMKGFAQFAEDKDDVIYYHHAGIRDVGWDIVELGKRYGLEGKLTLTSKDLSPSNFVSDEILNHIYNVADVGINTSTGEGWGLCLTKGSKIYTPLGKQTIEDISVGDEVYDANGNIQKVSNTFERDISENIVSLRVSGFSDAIEMTLNHPVLTKTGYKEARNITEDDMIYKPYIQRSKSLDRIDISKYGDFEYSKKHIYIRTGHRSGEYIRTKRELNIVRELFNRYLSKKSAHKYDRYYEIDKDLVEILAHIYATRFSMKHKFHNDSEKLFKKLNKLFNYRAKRKNNILPNKLYKALKNIAFDEEFYLSLDRNLLLIFLKKCIELQGYKHPTNQRLVLSAQRESKINIYEEILSRLGIRFSQFKIKDGTKYLSLNKTDIKQIYTLTTKTKVVKAYRNRENDIGGCYYRVLSKKFKPYTGKVYNIEVEKTHSYLVEGYAVHNCNVEHSMTGAAQIVPEHSANIELYSDDRGILLPVNPDYDYVNTQILTEGKVTSPKHVAKALQFLYDNRDKAKEIGENARKYFNQDQFRWKNISNRFREIFEND
jgi:glycosyltransferase involved in cell wall biosynthesis